MKASIVDLRYKSAKILQALERNEEVTVLYHGKVKGIIKPAHKTQEMKVKEHPFFGMYKSKEKQKSVDEVMADLRKPRHAV